MSRTPSSSSVSSWQAALMRLEADARQIRQSDEEQVQQVQAKREEARAQGAHLTEARKRLTARESRGSEDGALGPLRTAVAQAEQQERDAISAYETALSAFYKQRATMKKELQQLTDRRNALLGEIPQGTRQTYSDLIDRGVRDPVVARNDGRCGACGNNLSDEPEGDPATCPACNRLVLSSEI
jgi:predicted  nucleic acid-binding Zn-ribbon protein